MLNNGLVTRLVLAPWFCPNATPSETENESATGCETALDAGAGNRRLDADLGLLPALLPSSRHNLFGGNVYRPFDEIQMGRENALPEVRRVIKADGIE